MRLSPRTFGCALRPNIRGTFGPYTSASSRPTLCPSLDKTIARLTASVVFPTPPLPEPTAMIAPTPGRGCGDGGCCPGRGGGAVLIGSIIREAAAALGNWHLAVHPKPIWGIGQVLSATARWRGTPRLLGKAGQYRG